MERDDDGKASKLKSESCSEQSSDVVLIHGRTSDGKGLSVIRHRDNRFERGLVLPLEQGKPIQGEVVRLHPRSEHPLLCDVQVEYSQSQPRNVAHDTRVTKGPGQVATDQYRTNWDRIFDRKSVSDGDLN